MNDRIARKVREIRAHLGLNQAEFARKIGVSQGSVSKWESGREVPRGDTLSRISEASGLNLWSLRMGADHSHKRPGGVREATFVGSIQHGYAVEDVYWGADQSFEVLIPVSDLWQPVKLTGWIVKGISPWPQYPSSTAIIVATEFDEEHFEQEERVPSGFRYEHDDLVLVSVLNEDGLKNVTLKKYVLPENASLAYLWPLDGSTGDYQLPIELSFNSTFNGKVEILGLVVAALRFEASPERLIDLPDD